MRCEVCGREILGPPQRKVIEGAKLTVCGRCAGFGSNDWAPGRPAPIKTAGSPRARAAAPRPATRNDVEAVEQLEIVEEYGAKIRKARQKLGLTEKDLAMKMQEKESVIKNLEKEELTPDIRMIQKIKKYLGLDVVERSESAKAPILAKPTSAKTIGDLLQMGAKKEEEKP